MFIFVLAYDILFHLLCLDWSSSFMFLNLHFLGEYFGSLLTMFIDLDGDLCSLRVHMILTFESWDNKSRSRNSPFDPLQLFIRP